MMSSKPAEIVSYADLQPIEDLQGAFLKAPSIKNTTMGTGSNFLNFVIMIYARELTFIPPECWRWYGLKWVNAEVAELFKNCPFEVRGSVQMSRLRFGVLYDVMFLIRMNRSSYFVLKATFKLELPNGQVRQKEVLIKLPPKQWFGVKAGDFMANGEGEVKFSMLCDGEQNCKGLTIGGVLIKPSIIPNP